MSFFIDLALKRTSVVNVISRATGGSRDDACVLSQVDVTGFRSLRKLVGLTLRRLARSWFVLAFGEPVTSYLLYNGSASSSV